MPYILRKSEISREFLTELRDIYERLPTEERSPFNSPEFFSACWGSFKKRNPFCLAFTEAGRAVGAACFRHEILKLGGKSFQAIVPVTYRAAEFTDFLVLPEFRQSFLVALVESLVNEFCVVMIPHVLEQDWEALPDKHFRMINYSETLNPLVHDKGDGYGSIIGKKSLRRHTSWFKRHGTLQVNHICAEISPEKIKSFADMHIERWASEDVRSKFCSHEYVELYQSLFNTSLNKDKNTAAVFTEIIFNEQIIAMHIGFRWNKRFLYQIPVMNVEIMDRSPGEVLLRALFEYARDNNLNTLDLGYGAEAYKFRFANDAVIYRTYVLASSRTNAIELRCRKALARTQVVRTLRAKALSAWPKRLRRL